MPEIVAALEGLKQVLQDIGTAKDADRLSGELLGGYLMNKAREAFNKYFPNEES